MGRAAGRASIVALLLASLAPARAESWVPVGAAPNGTRYFVDLESLNREGAVARAWVLIDYPQAQFTDLVKGNNPYRSVLTLQDFDCAAGRHLGIEEQRFIAGPMGVGAAIYVIKFTAEQRAQFPHVIVPGSMIDLLFKRSCAR